MCEIDFNQTIKVYFPFWDSNRTNTGRFGELPEIFGLPEWWEEKIAQVNLYNNTGHWHDEEEALAVYMEKHKPENEYSELISDVFNFKFSDHIHLAKLRIDTGIYGLIGTPDEDNEELLERNGLTDTYLGFFNSLGIYCYENNAIYVDTEKIIKLCRNSGYKADNVFELVVTRLQGIWLLHNFPFTFKNIGDVVKDKHDLHTWAAGAFANLVYKQNQMMLSEMERLYANNFDGRYASITFNIDDILKFYCAINMLLQNEDIINNEGENFEVILEEINLLINTEAALNEFKESMKINFNAHRNNLTDGINLKPNCSCTTLSEEEWNRFNV